MPSGDNKENSEETRQKDIAIQINNLVNLLENRDSILLIRLIYKVSPSNLLDIWYISETEEKEELEKEMKLGKKKKLILFKIIHS